MPYYRSTRWPQMPSEQDMYRTHSLHVCVIHVTHIKSNTCIATNGLRAIHVLYTLVTCMYDTCDTYQEQYVCRGTRAIRVSYTLVTCMCDTCDTYQEQYVYSHKCPKSNTCIATNDLRAIHVLYTLVTCMCDTCDIANPMWGDIFESCFKAQSSKLESLFSLKRTAYCIWSVI